jgi:long-chain fatty acid transport protein
VPEQSSVAAATGGAGTARSDDPSAAWYNPAALSDRGGWRFGVGLTLAMPTIGAKAPDGSWSAQTHDALLTPPHLYVSQAWKRWATGVAVTVPYGASVEWPGDWAGKFEIVSTELMVFRVSPFVAYRFGDVRIAVGPHVDFGRLKVARKLDFVDTTGDVEIDMNGAGFGADIAMFIRASETVDVGLTYKSRTALSMDGNAKFAAPPAFSAKTPDQGAHADMTLPDRIALGTRWMATPKVALLGDLELNLWGTYDALNIDFQNMSTPDVHQKADWHATVAARAGAEWRAAPDWMVRGGLFVDPTPAPDSTLAPSSPDATRLGGTVGLGWNATQKLAIDGFYEYLSLLGRDAGNQENLAARYDGHAQLFGVGLRWQE